MRGWGQWLLCAGLIMVSAAVLPACPQQEGKAAEAVVKAEVQPPGLDLAGREVLRGGDRRAWLTGAGNLADNNYCRASLQLPLSSETAWEFVYTPAEFSRNAVNAMLHYDGLVVVAAHCSQLLGLNPDTGEQIFNRDVYVHVDTEGVLEDLSSLFFHPQGLLIGQDFQGRNYCWDLSGGPPERRWVNDGGERTRAVIADGGGVYCGWDESMHRLGLEDGIEQWSYPNLSGENGLVMSGSGLLVTWTQRGEFYCLDAASGSLKWAVYTNTRGREWSCRAVIDDVRSRVYFVLPDERLQCRNLAGGELIWEHDWSDVVPDSERERLYARFDADAIPLLSIDTCFSPYGMIVSTLSGNVIALDHDGNRRWAFDSDQLVLSGMGFENGLLVIEWYLGMDFGGINPAWRSFSADPPEWKCYQAADEQRQLNGSFQRFVVLDWETGERLDVFEPEYAVNAILPAHDMMVVGEADRTDIRQRRILAYRWLTGEDE